jgi:hypothetical protein
LGSESEIRVGSCVHLVGTSISFENNFYRLPFTPRSLVHRSGPSLRGAFRKLGGVGEAFDIKALHDVYKDPSMKGLSFKIHGLAAKLENLPVVKRAARHHFVFDDGGSDDDGGTPTN